MGMISVDNGKHWFYSAYELIMDTARGLFFNHDHIKSVRAVTDLVLASERESWDLLPESVGLPQLVLPEYSDLFPYCDDDWYEGLDPADRFDSLADYFDWAVNGMAVSLLYLEDRWARYLEENHLENFREALPEVTQDRGREFMVLPSHTVNAKGRDAVGRAAERNRDFSKPEAPLIDKHPKH